MSNYVPPVYTPENLSALYAQIEEISRKLFNGTMPSVKPNTIQGHQFYHYGVRRRLMLIRENYEYLICLFPPERGKALNSEEISEAILHLNSLYFHIWGCIDNLAWVVAYETNYLSDGMAPSKVGKRSISLFNKGAYTCIILKWFHKSFFGLKNKSLREHVSSICPDFYKDEKKYKGWIEKLGKRRHPAAHRIPLYMVPYFLTTKQEVTNWEIRAEKTTNQIMEGIKERNGEMLREAGITIDKLGQDGMFFPNITHELKFSKEGNIKRESFDPLYPTIMDDCDLLLRLVEKCTTLLSTIELPELHGGEVSN